MAKARTTETKRRPRGRPTKYRPEFCQMLLDYMQQEPFDTLKLERTNSKGEKWIEEKRTPAKIKFLEDFAWEIIGTTPQTLIEWADKHKNFGEAYSRARHMQKAHLLQCGFAGVSDSAMTKFAAVNLTDLRDKVEVDQTGTVEHRVVMFSAPSKPVAAQVVGNKAVRALPAPNPVDAVPKDRESVGVKSSSEGALP